MEKIEKGRARRASAAAQSNSSATAPGSRT